MLVTTNYQMINYVKNPISIDRCPPWWFKGPSIKCLAPKDDLLYLWNTSKITFDEFRFRYYYDVLRICDAWNILRLIEKMTNSKVENCALLNSESSNCMNTRSFIVDWLHNQTGIKIKEYSISDDKENQISKIIQPSSYTDIFKYSTFEEINDYMEKRKVLCENELSNQLNNELLYLN